VFGLSIYIACFRCRHIRPSASVPIIDPITDGQALFSTPLNTVSTSKLGVRKYWGTVGQKRSPSRSACAKRCQRGIEPLVIAPAVACVPRTNP
jgi:hypothetical protein